jgi:Flp pilus assembly pilin Flp
MLKPWLHSRVDERGLVLLEYLILAGVVAIVVIVGIAYYADEVMDWFVAVGGWVSGGSAPAGPVIPVGSAPPTPD